MVVHHCFRCGFSSKKKKIWERHFNNSCEVKYLDLTKDEMMHNYGDYLECYMELACENGYEFRCGTCNFITKHKRSYNRHLKEQICENRIVNNEIADLRRRLQLLESHMQTPSINIGGITIENNTTQTYVNGDNNTINVAHNYGSEDRSHLTYDKYMEIFECLPDAIPRLVEELHYKVPENRNMTIPNIRGDAAKVLINGIWVYKELKQFLEDLFIAKHDAIEDFATRNKDRIPRHILKNIHKMLIRTAETHGRKIQQKKIKNVIVSNRHLVEDS